MTDVLRMSTPDRSRIVVGVDGSDGLQESLAVGRELAASLGARLDVVAAWEVTTIWNALPSSYSPQPDIEQLLDQTVHDVFGPDRPSGMRLKVLEGPAARVLLDVSKDALMIVVGNRGLRALAGVVLGSVSLRVAEHANCPVLVARGPVPA
jgi:nucleotide-binding universal stress UspA family protein